jgi:hypothetical protein
MVDKYRKTKAFQGRAKHIPEGLLTGPQWAPYVSAGVLEVVPEVPAQSVASVIDQEPVDPAEPQHPTVDTDPVPDAVGALLGVVPESAPPVVVPPVAVPTGSTATKTMQPPSVEAMGGATRRPPVQSRAKAVAEARAQAHKTEKSEKTGDDQN